MRPEHAKDFAKATDSIVVFLDDPVRDINILEDAPDEPIGDGKAEVLTDMTESEYAQYMHEEEQGWKEFYNKLRGK